MVKEICKDEHFLAQKAQAATPEDQWIGQDLMDTLLAHQKECVGMAANMIGQDKRIIVFDNQGEYMLMYNPQVLRRSAPNQTEEGCLSLIATRPVKRWKTIKVQYQNQQFALRIKTFTGFTAQIIQHEIDHCEGMII